MRDIYLILIVEYDNPGYIHIRDSEILRWEKDETQFKSGASRRNQLYFSRFSAKEGDRIIFFSDGVTQSGLGSSIYPLGYGDEIETYIKQIIKNNNNISAKDLARIITDKANINDNMNSKDDISCVVIYFRRPRKAMLVTGPPVCNTRDSLLAKKVDEFSGERIICGGTTSNI